MTVETLSKPKTKAAPAEIEAITQAITDYMEPWYGAGHEKLVDAIHPSIVKRKFYANPETGVFVLGQTTADQLIGIAKDCAAQGSKPADQWQNDITILDVFQNIATAKSVGSMWTDYLHLAKLDGRWQIMHILFDNPRDDVPAADQQAIHQTILDYMESWYSHEYERLDRSFHPALMKRGFYPLRQSGVPCISISTVSEMVERVRGNSLSDKPRLPKDEWIVEIEILDVYQEIATSKTVGKGSVDYMHLADVNGEWKIVNILYDLPKKD
jgi:hypothetical protein